MVKLVVLKLDSEAAQQGWRVTLSVGEEGLQTSTEITGYLPYDLELTTQLQHHWQQNYRRLCATYRIKPKTIIYDGSINERIQECLESANKLRSHFRTWLDSESFRPLDKRLREELHRYEVIRVLIRTDEPFLQKLPWQEWDFFERYPKAEMALSATEFERVNTTTTSKLKTPVKILAILGNSVGINTDADRKLLADLPLAKTTFLVEPTRQEINEQLWSQAWDIIFFAGHSETDGETGRIYLNQTESLTISELWYALKKAVERGLKLAIFNSCDGLGLARKLDDLQIPQMIVMRELVPDFVAQTFLKDLLTALASGKPFYLAAREARERLQGLEGQFPCASWLPVICQNLASDSLTWPEPYPKLNQHWRRILLPVLLASIVSSSVMGIRAFGVLQPWELKTFDQLMQRRPTEQLDSHLLIVKVTAEDIAKLGNEYPLHDATLLQLLRKIEAEKPRIIGLDIYRDRPEGKGYADLITYFKNSKMVIPVCIVPSPKMPRGISPPAEIDEEKIGFGDVVRDPDGVVRRHLLAMAPPAASPCSTYYALSFKLALRYLQNQGISLHFNSKNTWQLGSLTFNKLQANTGFYQQQSGKEGFQILLNYRSNQLLENIAQEVTLTDVLLNRVKPSFIKDKIILIGVTDYSVKDDFKTPYGQEIRGLRLHAQMVSQLISAVENQRPLLWFFPLGVDVFFVWIWSVMGGVSAWYFRSPLCLGISTCFALITLNGICLVSLLTSGGLLPLVPGAIAFLVTGASIVAYRAFPQRRVNGNIN